ncbi:MAG: thioredoxin family protein [Candidatus Taylorbacteria bacterium CG11_big_fil_rev_8_21_14_0_20_46_11]|uniref:Thioredoxin family protein n=1 Tax=Candidatus Taylorbacteria bacterium CG11_big_fil_rev_8_21_14_0_20_46_11 TaxID=1975025 RepID=A0A2H0KAY7_9BACT|nr:MAG: thioredoxin family protein [Candidatus Taylorbacteria bacterium CG11_big_fil_rev_8_21_14_0_20_46_11]
MLMKNQSIRVLGSGCPTCKKFLKTVKKAAAELKIDAEVEYSADTTEIIKMGVMASPVLAINGRPVLTGAGHSQEDIKNALLNNLPEEK